MAKAIFTTRVTPSYDDLPESRYHFPRTYLNQVTQAVGDSIIYYEPGRSSADGSVRAGRQVYFAIANVNEVVEDEKIPDHFYALISNYLTFDKPVPFASNGHYFESQLRKSDGTPNRGAFGRAVRIIPDSEFDQILKSGFATQIGPVSDGNYDEGFDEPSALFERPLVELTVSHPFRDRLFKKVVRSAYQNQCAFTGLQILNGGGRPEVQAAHIVPVELNGPDSVRNGLALSGTIHWLFGRGLISVDDEFGILAAKHKIPTQIVGLLNASRKTKVPNDKSSWPHRQFLKFHRETIFKG